MPRFFTLQQAQKVLPEVEAAIREAIGRKSEYEREQVELREFLLGLARRGGVQVDRSKVMERNNRRDAAAAALKQSVENIQRFGCLVKDLDTGLIDFPTLLKGEEVYLCWKLGEPGIQFWHGIHEGFRGRKPIDADFLNNHRGEIPN